MQELDIALESSISLEAELYDLFYRKRGVRRIAQIANPIFSDIGATTFPKNSIYHYNPESPLLFGPQENNPWFVGENHLKFIEHVASFKTETIGTIVRKPGSEIQYIQAYRRKHRTLKLMRNFFNINAQPNMLIIYNYCLLNQLYKYRPHRFISYFNFQNLYSTILTKINQVANQSDRHQFFELRLPKTILTRSYYRSLAKEYFNTGMTNRMLHFFSDSDAWLIFHLWMWMGDERSKSIFNLIEQKNLSKVNLLLTESGKYVLINLGELNKWITEESNEDDFEEMDDDGTIISNRALGIRVKFYNLLNKLLEFRTGAPSAIKVEPVTYTEAELNDTSEVEDDEGEVSQPIQPIETKPKSLTDSFISAVGKVTDTKVQTTEDKAKQQIEKSKTNTFSRVLKPLPKEEPDEQDTVDNTVSEPEPDSKLAGQSDKVELPEEVQEVVPDEPETEYIPEDPYKDLPEDPYQRLPLREAMNKVKEGEMSAREFQRIQRQAEAYTMIPNPFDESGKTSLKDFMESNTKEDVEIKPIEVPDSDWILDKNMLKTTVEPLTRQYIDKSLKRDVVKSLMSIQKAGMMVTDLKLETQNDVASKYDIWKMKVQPIGGTEATVTIKLPHVDKEGRFKVNGIYYNLRAQRKDLPIRKVSTDKVALTSYYSKLSVSKAERRTFNLESFYHTQLNAKIIDKDIIHVEYSNRINTELDVPTEYHHVASRFKRFELLNDKQVIYFNFDYNNRSVLINNDDKRLAELEAKYDGVIFAKDKSHLYFISKSDNMVYSTDQGYQPKPLYEFLAIEKEPPLEMAEIKVFSNSIPLVFLLGYYKGLSGLLRELNVRPRKVFRGQRPNLSSTEYAIKFADEVWVFDRRDTKAAIILSGFNHYKRYIEDYAVDQFDNKDTFIAILSDAGLTMQVENEFKLMEMLWVDEITKELLIQMQEPTDFVSLLFRAAELLTIPYSRAEVNMDDMIIAGYQRIAGQIYKQLAVNVKTMMNNRSILAKKRFDMPPTHILQTIMKDPSVSLVDDINPIHNLKEHENITFGGDGGRSRRSMVSRTRTYSKSDLGVISEATVDSADVAVTTFLSANPALTTTLGNSKRIDTQNTSAAEVLSTTSNLYVASTRDDQQY